MNELLKMTLHYIDTYDYRIGSYPRGAQMFPITEFLEFDPKTPGLVRAITFTFDIHVKYLKRFDLRDLGTVEVLIDGRTMSITDFATLSFLSGQIGKRLIEKKFGLFDLFNRKLKFSVQYNFSHAIRPDKYIEILISNDLAENLKKYNFMECKIYKVADSGLDFWKPHL